MDKMKKAPPKRTLTVSELLAALSTAAGEPPGPKLAEQLGTSRAQVARLLGGGVDLRWSTLERAVEALGRLEGTRLRVRLVVERQQPTE